jgi:excisionase family DNA binding protein
MQGPMTYSIADACAATSCGRTTIYEAIRSGNLRAIKIGRRTVITATDLAAWLDSRNVVGHPTTHTERSDASAKSTTLLPGRK